MINNVNNNDLKFLSYHFYCYYLTKYIQNMNMTYAHLRDEYICNNTHHTLANTSNENECMQHKNCSCISQMGTVANLNRR